MNNNKTEPELVNGFDNIQHIAKTVVSGLIILATAAVVIKIGKVMVKDLKDMGL